MISRTYGRPWYWSTLLISSHLSFIPSTLVFLAKSSCYCSSCKRNLILPLLAVKESLLANSDRKLFQNWCSWGTTWVLYTKTWWRSDRFGSKSISPERLALVNKNSRRCRPAPGIRKSDLIVSLDIYEFLDWDNFWTFFPTLLSLISPPSTLPLSNLLLSSSLLSYPTLLLLPILTSLLLGHVKDSILPEIFNIKAIGTTIRLDA